MPIRTFVLIISDAWKADCNMKAEELYKKMLGVSINYFLVDIRKDRDDFYSLTQNELNENKLLLSGFVLNLIMDGELEKATELINSLPENDVMRIGLTIVNPAITWREFISAIESLKKTNRHLKSVILTAGRPNLLNGFNDFTRIGPLLETHKKLFIEDFKYIYEEKICPALYDLCLAEYYYQQNRIFDAEILVSRTIREFDVDSERRLLFAALYLQSKILIVHGRTVNAESYIKEIRRYVKKNGEAEFSYNIDSAEALCAMYEGNYQLISAWFQKKSPDEYADFNMLDLYRYMIKMRCYIFMKDYMAVIALAEKLRPLLIAGRRHMDICEIELLLAMSFYYAQKKEMAFQALDRALKIAKRRRYYRLIADEGEMMLHVLISYANEKGQTPFLMQIIEMTRDMAISHPLYLKAQYKNTHTFTQMEIAILKLLEQGKSKEEIGEYFFISINTVKYHMKKIYAKLGASSTHQAVWQAKRIGII